MGFLFNPDKKSENFDGLYVSLKYIEGADTLFIHRDVWTSKRPFTNGDVYPGNLEFEQADDWNITAPKSSVTCPAEGTLCTIKAHFNRKFQTGDDKDYQMEHGTYLGYEVIGFYQISGID